MFLASHGPLNASSVLLLHGGGVAGWMWGSLTRRLQSDFRVLVPDLPGHGRSVGDPYVSHAVTVGALARLLEDNVPGRRVAVVGFSLGAQVAVQLAAERPDLVGEVVVVSAQAKPIRFTGLILAGLALCVPLARQRWFAKLQARELFIPVGVLEEYIRTSAGITKGTLLAAVGANLRFELPADWSTFPGRAVLMVGERERRVMRDSADLIHRALPGSELEVVGSCGHGIPFQREEWFNDRIASLLSEA